MSTAREKTFVVRKTKLVFANLTFHKTSYVSFILVFAAYPFPSVEELGGKVDNLDATEDREAGEESHCASNHTQLGNQGHLMRDGTK